MSYGGPYLKLGALADYTKAIELDPRSATAYTNRGAVKYDLGDKQGALADHTIAIELDPKSDIAYANRGAVKYDLEDRQGAIADWIVAARLGNEYARKQLKDNGYSW
jgi:tetratricopeptide (TPR) repeat protein